jgi:HlyD family secretion protein
MYNENKLSDLRDAALNELNQATINEITKQISALETDMQKDYTTNTINSIRSLIAIEEQTIEQLERDVADCTIKTDVSGFVSVLPIMHTTLVSYQFMACTIMVEQDMVVESYVSTDDIVYVSIGDTVELVHEARDGDITYEGTITDIESWAGEQISKSGARSNKVKIVIQPSEEMKTVKNGYKLNVSYTISKADDELILPDSVFYSKNNADYVFIVDRQDGKNNGVLRAVPVKKGMSVNSRTVVLEGVAEGDIIVKDASENNLAEGISVSW